LEEVNGNPPHSLVRKLAFEYDWIGSSLQSQLNYLPALRSLQNKKLAGVAEIEKFNFVGNSVMIQMIQDRANLHFLDDDAIRLVPAIQAEIRLYFGFAVQQTGFLMLAVLQLGYVIGRLRLQKTRVVLSINFDQPEWFCLAKATHFSKTFDGRAYIRHGLKLQLSGVDADNLGTIVPPTKLPRSN
jgi:hypothetical protein